MLYIMKARGINVAEFTEDTVHIDGLVQERCNSSALAMELCLSCINLAMG